MSSNFRHNFASVMGTSGSSDFSIVPISDVPYSDVHCIYFLEDDSRLNKSFATFTSQKLN